MSLLGFVRGLIGQHSELPADTVITPPLVEPKNLEDPVHDGANLAEIVRNQAPPVELGIPVLTLEQLLVTQKELIDQLQTIGEIDIEEFRTLVMPLIERFASFVHLLPASENYHHHGTGGLLNHSLDVALRAGRIISSKCLQSQGASPSENNAKKKRWPYVAMVAGLCHDLAKPFSDFEVTDMERKIVWDPFSENLLEWAQRNNLMRYRYTWNKNRYGKHEQISGGLLHQVLTPDFLAWLREGGSSVTYPLFQVIAYGSATPNINPLRSVVLEADQRSTITDVHRWQEARKEIGMKVKMERYMLNIIKEQILSEEWTVNENDSIVWVVEGDVFLDWKEASAFLIYKLEELELTGLPSTGPAIADLLINADIAMRNLSDPNRPRRFWDISIQIPTKEGEGITIQKEVLRFVSPDYILDRIYESKPGARILKSSASNSPDTPVPASPSQELSSAGDVSTTGSADHEVTPPSDEMEQTISPREGRNHQNRDDAPDPVSLKEDKKSDARSVDRSDIATHTATTTSPVGAKDHSSPATTNHPDKRRDPHTPNTAHPSSNPTQNTADHVSWNAGATAGEKAAAGKVTDIPKHFDQQKNKKHVAKKVHKTTNTGNLFSGPPPAVRSNATKQKVNSIRQKAAPKAAAESKSSTTSITRDDLIKDLVQKLSASNRLDHQIRLGEDGSIFLLFPDGFLGHKKPSILKKLFVKERIVSRTDSEIMFLVDPSYKDVLLPLINNRKNKDG